MSNRHQRLVLFVLRQAARQPVLERVELIRAVSDICGQAEQSKQLCVLANELEAAEKRSEEFQFNYQLAANFTQGGTRA